jgi:ribosomal protein L34E
MAQPRHLTANEQAQVTFDTLDGISRERALSEAESMLLEHAYRRLQRGYGGYRINKELARAGVKRPRYEGFRA